MVSMWPMSAARALSMSAMRHRTLARSRGFIFCQSLPGSICARAARTAASTSSAPRRRTVGDLFLGGRIAGDEGLAGTGIDEFAVDEELVLDVWHGVRMLT